MGGFSSSLLFLGCLGLGKEPVTKIGGANLQLSSKAKLGIRDSSALKEREIRHPLNVTPSNCFLEAESLTKENL